MPVGGGGGCGEGGGGSTDQQAANRASLGCCIAAGTCLCVCLVQCVHTSILFSAATQGVLTQPHPPVAFAARHHLQQKQHNTDTEGGSQQQMEFGRAPPTKAVPQSPTAAPLHPTHSLASPQTCHSVQMGPLPCSHRPGSVRSRWCCRSCPAWARPAAAAWLRVRQDASQQFPAGRARYWEGAEEKRESQSVGPFS